MVNATVERATSDMLIGPDWAMNIEICDMLNQNPGQAKDVAKSIKKRITSKNSKVQLLALTLLETIIKNCGDVVHMHVAEKDVLHEMVRLVKKKPDYHVKEKILILIDTWQEAFGGPRARYPQYYAAYQELLRAGAVFPQRSERSAPVFTPPQTQPLASYPQNMRSSDYNVDRAETSSEADYPTLSLSEIQNARGAMDILSEMLSAIEPGNKQALRQEVVVDLVDQCRTYKQRVVHLVNSTSDESLLCQGLTLNDDLQRLLAKHEAIASGTFVKPEKPKPESSKSLVDVDSPLVDTGDNGKLVDGSSTGVNALVPLTPPPAANGPTTTPQTVSKIDLLSGDLLGGDDFNSLALVPVSTPQPPSPVASDQNALALVDMFPVSNSNQNTASAQLAFSSGQAYPMSPEFQHQQHLQVPQAAVNMNGSIPGMVNMNGSNAGMGSPYEQAAYPQTANAFWNGQSMQQQQPTSPVYGAQNGGAYPPPPWESQPTDNTQPFGSAYPQMQLATISGPQSPRLQGSTPPLGLPNPGGDQVVGMFVQPITGGQLTAINQSFQGNQMPGMYPQHMQGAQMMGMLPQSMQAGQTASMYPQQIYGNQMAGYGYGYGYGYGQGQQQDTQFLEHRMYGLSMSDNSALKNSSSQSSLASYLPPMKQANKGDDKLFGDLVDMAKTKPVKSTPGGTGSV